MNANPPPAKETTPLMKQYEQLKAEHPEEILLFRLGDFYEMFADDAKNAAPVLEVALTQRQGVPMCGIPHHALERYVPKLLQAGLRVAVAEQTEDPAAAKGIVKREVTRMISAGTIVEEKLLSEKANNFLAAVALDPPADPSGQDGLAALAALDISTGQFIVSEFRAGAGCSNLISELHRLRPAELLWRQGQQQLAALPGIPYRALAPADFAGVDPEQRFDGKPAGPGDAHLKGSPLAQDAVKMILHYAEKMNPGALPHLQRPQWTAQAEVMTLDRETIENLEILRNAFDETSAKSLLSFLDRTLTPMGGRLLRQWLVRPLVRLPAVLERLSGVEHFVREPQLRRACREALKGAADLERLVVRIGSGRAGPRDLLGLKLSLMKVVRLKEHLRGARLPAPIAALLARLEGWSPLIDLLERAVADDPPVFLDNGGAIRPGYDAALDEKRKAAEEGKSWLQDLEKREREATQISNLKIAYTSVFGYYFEVTKSQLGKVPAAWHRKQTLVNNERFINEDLKNLEQKILGAEEQSLRIEREIFVQLAAGVRGEAERIQSAAAAAAQIDVLMALAETAEVHALAKPELDDSDALSISDGWHPMVKESLPAGAFVPNDVSLDGRAQQIAILTGPNMSGKSTYLRQIALTVLMAQIGSFVPARAARIGIADRIFTRIGSGDRLSQGQSTFMVEMQETARILRDATGKSLIILDEVGRGTSTYDGISIAWAVIEYLAAGKNGDPKPKVLFATHYFELTHLAEKMEGVKNYNVQAKEWKDSVLFLHKIAPGPADRSYGIHVAQLAGLPPDVIARAKKILSRLESDHLSMLESRGSTKQQLFDF